MRLICAAYFTKSYIAAVYGFFRCKLNPSYTLKGIFCGLPFCFRSSDVEALKEVLFHEEYAFLENLIKQTYAPQIIDVGHHIGCFSLWAISKNPDARIIAIEADPYTYAIAKKNAKLSAQKNNWILLHRAAWKNDLKVPFSVEGNTMGHKVLENGDIEVQGISLKTLLAMVTKEITVLKVDIEGAEEAFLSESSDLLSKKVKTLVIEIHPTYCNEKKVRKILEDNFDNVMPIENTQTAKPLLWCYN